MSNFLKNAAGAGCLVQTIVFAIYGAVSWWAIDTITNYFGKDLPWIADIIIGVITGVISIWIGFAVWLFG